MNPTKNHKGEPRQHIVHELEASERGLEPHQVEKQRSIYGWNEIPAKKQSIIWLILRQFNDVMVYILLAAAAVSVITPYAQTGNFSTHEILDAVVILGIVLLNAILGFFQEWRAENAISLLQKLSAPKVKVRRAGVLMILPSRELLPKDIICLEAGDRISADARIIVSSSIEVDEASLTGESLPVSKYAVENMTPDQSSLGMLWSSTLVTRGYAEAVVTAIGTATEIGKITSMMINAKSPETPLEIELKKVGARIGVIVLALCVLIFGAGILNDMDVTQVFFVAVSIAVAAVPEGLPAVVTICLAIGVQRMIKKKALVRRLDAVETLGNVTIICSDKTGTMTENLMVVQKIWIPKNGNEKHAIEISASCNRAELPNIGDPTEVALLQHAEKENVVRLPLVDEEVPFTSEAKYMVTIHEKGSEKVRYLKGAPEVIAKFLPDAERREVLEESEHLSQNGLRVLAVAHGSGENIVFAGLIAMIDAPRKGVKGAIEQARRAGIRTIMITGDHPATALAIAKSVGLTTEGIVVGDELEAMDIEDLQHALKHVSVFARVKPAHKVKILQALQAQNHVVAMTGDGVNDAPALKSAHVGIAMGLKGTDVARESAAMVLTDDNFATIVAAIAEGRRIYDNIKKFVIFLMRSNIGEVCIIGTAMILGIPLPLLPLHILWINVVTDTFPALALAAEGEEKGIMDRAPRQRDAGIFTGEWTLLFFAGFLNAILSLGMFWLAYANNPENLTLARTVALTSTVIFQMFLAISTRSRRPVFFDFRIKNQWLLGGIACSLALHALLLLTPVSTLFSVTAIPIKLLGIIIGSSLVAFILFECAKLFDKKGNERQAL